MYIKLNLIWRKREEIIDNREFDCISQKKLLLYQFMVGINFSDGNHIFDYWCFSDFINVCWK